jgi:two-component system response regulator PilR (NtrC family)
MARSGHGSGNTSSISLSTEAFDALKEYDFPGNIRELENLLERACALCENNLISVHDLALNSLNTGQASANSAATAKDLEGSIETNRIVEALAQTHWNRKAAAQLLGVSYRQLRYRIKKFGLENTDKH